MNNYFFKKEKVIELLNKIQKDLKEKKKILNKAFELDYKEWEIKVETEKLIKIVENLKQQDYLPKFSKQEIIDGIGKIVLVNSSNTYMIFNFILSSIYTNNKVTIILEEKMLASNKTLIELIRKSMEDLKYDSNIVNYKEVINKEEIISYQDDFDLLYYLGNKEEYLNFIKRIHIDSKFENFGELYIYVDNKDFKEQIINIDKFAYRNEIKVYYFNTNFENSVEIINKVNNINKTSIIFTKNIEKAYEFVKKVKTERVYINEEPDEEFIYNVNLKNLIFHKKIMLKK